MLGRTASAACCKPRQRCSELCWDLRYSDLRQMPPTVAGQFRTSTGFPTSPVKSLTGRPRMDLSAVVLLSRRCEWRDLFHESGRPSLAGLGDAR